MPVLHRGSLLHRDECFWRARIALWFSMAGIFLSGSCLASIAKADDPVQIRVGFERCLKVGRWTPILVTESVPQASTCEVMALDPDGVRVTYPLSARTILASGSRPWSGVVRTGRLDADLEIRLLDEHRTVIAQQRLSPRDDSERPLSVLRQSIPLWLEVGTATSVLSESLRLKVVRSAAFPDATAMPHGLDGVDGVWATSTASLGPESDSANVEIIRWLKQGGHLILSVTTDAEEFAKTHWAEMLRELVEVQRRLRTNDLSSVESFVAQSRRIPAANRVFITTLAPRHGRVLANGSEGAFITRASFGFGQVTVLGLDLSVAPLSRWDGRTAFCQKLLFRDADAGTGKSTENSRLSQSGITDLASQWRAAAIEIPDIPRPSLWSVLGLLLLYAALIGPLDYLIVHRMGKRPHWTWASLPVLVAGAVLGTTWLARAVNSESPRLTQLDVLDIDAARHDARVASFATLYSPESRLTDVTSEPLTAGPTTSTRAASQVSWLGFPENASGGLYRPSGWDFGELMCRSSEHRDALTGLPIRRWATKSLVAEAAWSFSSALIEADLTSAGGGELSGRVVHHLPTEIQDWIVAYENRVFRPHPKHGDEATHWRTDEPWDPNSPRVYQRELRGFLTRTTATKIQSKKLKVSEDILVEQERYNPLNLAPDDILQMLTLHEAAGGKAYTGLDHHSLRAWDWTPMLTLDRAVLIGRISATQMRWRFDGTALEPTRVHAFVRALLPVRRESSRTDNLRVLPKFERTDQNATPPANPEPPANNSTKETPAP